MSIFTYKNLYRAYLDCRKNKRKTINALKFELNFEENLHILIMDIIHREWSGLEIKDHKNIKNLKGHNLRDNMTEAELVFTSLAELTTRNIAEKDKTVGFSKNAVSAKKGGSVAGRARKDFELQTGNKVISGDNLLQSKRKIKKIKN